MLIAFHATDREKLKQKKKFSLFSKAARETTDE